MPATVLSGWPKDGASWSQARKTGPNPMSGGRGSGTTTPSEDAKGGGPEIKGAGCKHTHVTAGTTGTSTSTTKTGHSPTRLSGCCPNGWGREVNSRDGQKPIDEQPPRSQTNEKFQSPLSRPNRSCDRKGQSEKRPYMSLIRAVLALT